MYHVLLSGYKKISCVALLAAIQLVSPPVAFSAADELQPEQISNAIEQAKQFISATKLDSITMTKLDGTAKGGVVIGISDQFQIPVRYIGVGEGMADLQIFNKKEFVNSLFN